MLIIINLLYIMTTLSIKYRGKPVSSLLRLPAEGQHGFVMTHFVGIVISSRSFGLAQFFILIVFIYLHVIAIPCTFFFLLVLNDIDHMKAWHTFSGGAGN